MTNLQANNITKDTNLLVVTRQLLQNIDGLLQNERPPHGKHVTYLIQMIDPMSQGWQNHLKAVGDEDILTHWDNLICKSVAFMIP